MMELDSFTEKLIERTLARRDYLNQKLSEINQLPARKRRTSDGEENNYQFEVTDDTRQVDDSPKRQCMELSSEADSTDGETSENKENLQAESDCNNLFVPIHATAATRGLAALRKTKQLCNEENELHKPPQDEIKLGFEVSSRAALISKTHHSANSRFAALAATIKNWDDDSSNSSSVTAQIVSYNKPAPVSTSSNTSSSSESSNVGDLQGEIAIPKQLKSGNFRRVTFDLSSKSPNGDGCLVNSQSMPNCAYSPQMEPKSHLKSSKKEQQESQGFVKSSSKSKISYDFSPSKKQTPTKLPAVSQDSRIGNLSSQKPMEPPGKNSNPIKSVTVGCVEPKQDPKPNQAAVCVSNVPSTDGCKDPAELPLSSRRALFEKAFCGGVQKQVENTIESNLSVAQRAALFEKAAKQSNVTTTCKTVHKNPASPMKQPNNGYPSSPVKNGGDKREPSVVKSPTNPKILSEPKLVQNTVRNDSPSRTIGSPVKTQTLTSPLRNLGPHTLMLHERLSTCVGWQNKEIVVKAQEERKNEISALRNHWEKVSSSSVESNQESSVVSERDRRNPITSASSLEEEKASSVFSEEDESSCSLQEIAEENDMDDNQCSSNSSGVEWDEEMPSERNSDNGEYAASEDIKDITGEAVAVCDEIDELLNEALDSQAKSSPPLPSPEKEPQKWPKVASYVSASSSASHQSSLDNFSSTPKSPCAIPTRVHEDAPDISLHYSLSNYRKQEQEAKITPVRRIVRREPVLSPPSPQESDKTFDLQERIRALNNEILLQQNKISQVCNYLNICSAKSEFSGSTEEVEGEKVLLQAIQIRQACLNEIQRLKTLRCEKAEDGEGTLTINNICLPLKRDFIATQLVGENDMIHYFLCLIRHRAQVVFTQMLSSKEIHNGCLNFTNHINIQNLDADFSVAFEVYTLQRKKEVLPHEKKYHIKNKRDSKWTPKGKKADSKTPAVSSPGGPCAVRTPSFSIVGFTRFILKNSDRESCTLEKVPFSSPLEGNLRFKLFLHVKEDTILKCFLTMFEDVTGFGSWHRRYCVLTGSVLTYWKFHDDYDKKKKPIGSIDLTRCVTGEVRLVSRDRCARPHTFQIVIVRPLMEGDRNTLISSSVNTLTTTRHLLSADTKEERILWCQKLNEVLKHIRKWNPRALKPIEIQNDDK